MNANIAKDGIIPKGYTVVFLSVTQWSAKRHLQSADLGIKDFDKKLANLGTLNAFDKEYINKFRNMDNRANALCAEYGVKFAGGYLFPEVKEKWLIDGLRKIQKEWYELKEKLLVNYNEELKEWAAAAEAEFEGFGEIILQRAFSKEYIDKQISFNWHGIEYEVASLGSQLLDSLAEKAREKLKSLEDKKGANPKKEYEISRMDMRFFEGMHKKLKINKILDKRIEPLVEEIDELYALLATIPEKEKLSEHPKFIKEYVKTIVVLTNPDALYGGFGVASKPNSITSIKSNDLKEKTESKQAEATEAKEENNDLLDEVMDLF